MPLTAVSVVGAKLTLNVTLWAGAMAAGTVIPDAEYPAPLAVSCETFAVAFPVLVIVTFFDAVVPILTLPKLKVEGVAVSVEETAVPVPDNAIEVGEFVALLVMEMFPVKFAALCGANCAVMLVLPPAAIDSGVVGPLTLKPVPLAAIWLIVRLPVPVFVKVIDCEFVVPFATLPKLTLFGAALIAAWVPVPVKLSTVDELPALLANDTLPVAAPAVVGAYFTCSAALCPTFSIAGVATPVAVKPPPVTVSPVICTAACPEFVNVTGSVALLPSATPPKLKLAGLSVSCPTAVAEPVPVNAIAAGEVGSLLVIEILPVSFCAAVGEYVAVSVADWPAVIVFGVVTPDTPKVAPETVMTETVRSALPVLLKVTAEVLLAPVVTFPKFTLGGFKLS